jgi:CHAD domain-containing protein
MSEHHLEDQEQNESADKNTISTDLLNPLIDDLKNSAQAIIESSAQEGTHLIRVTLRKIRAWVGLCKSQLSAEQIADITSHVRWISDITGPARDADVQLSKTLSTDSSLPKTAKTKLKKQQSDSYANIIKELQNDKFKDFTSLLNAVAENIAINDTLTSDDIRARVQKLTKKSMKLGDDLRACSTNEEFHTVRKRLKKLCYTLGFQMHFNPDKKLIKAEKALKQIQEYLGDFQDQTVLAKELDLKAEELMKAGEEERQELFELGVSTGETRSHIQALKAGFPNVYAKFGKAITKYLLND